MQVARIGGIRLLCLAILSSLALLPGLGSSSRLTYHEAFVAQGAREIVDSGNGWYPTIGGLPWLEKPPLPWWLVAGVGSLAGDVNETVARLPSAVAAIGLVMGVAVLGARHYGSGVGLLAGAIQATTAWTVFRGRLAEADILLACLITWAIVAFDRIGPGSTDPSDEDSAAIPRHWRFWRWTFMVLLGSTALVKGIGFGAVLVGSVVAGALLWQRDKIAFRRLRFPAGWSLAAIFALAWPVVMVAWHGHGVLSLWTTHVSDRLVRQNGPGPFAGETWWEYGTTIFAQALPWAPLALPGAWRSLVRAIAGSRLARNGSSRNPVVPAEVIAGDRLLLGLGIRTALLAGTGPRQERPLCDLGSGSLVDLGRIIAGEARRAAATARFSKQLPDQDGADGVRFSRPGLRPGPLASGTMARSPGGGMGLLRDGRPPDSHRCALDVAL